MQPPSVSSEATSRKCVALVFSVALVLLSSSFLIIVISVPMKIIEPDAPVLEALGRVKVADVFLAQQFLGTSSPCRHLMSSSQAAKVCLHQLLSISRRSTLSLAAVPEWWRVHSQKDVSMDSHSIGSGAQKRVMRCSLIASPETKVVLKTSLPVGPLQTHRSNVLGGSMHIELLYLEFLRGLPGVPALYGAWFDESGQLFYVVEDGGRPLGSGTGTVQDPAVLSSAFLEAARLTPISLVRGLFSLFMSFSEMGGFFLLDFTPKQVRMLSWSDLECLPVS